ncbi:AraC family transcriptional regulator [Streptomyces sp. NBC_01264]|uniref:AraC family transcriptional regulator n=1 Tax=Streptomyces sp. NBC_01264 TaxID=2903804 RepID=UPI0022573E10|nr:AraC family transcriptional regulator [Streptomyces sp. NBC_01264]MCX4778254.1 AraC family transcriptional regulator [Streptomyces sp. NBC_01264]
MDVLADVLASTGFTGALLAQLHSNGSQWGCDLDQGSVAGFHLIADGACWLRTANTAPVQLVSGDVVLLPRGTPHQLLGSPGTETRPYSEVAAENPPGRTGVVHLGGDGPLVRIVCGKFQYATSTDRHPVLSVLPEVVHVPGMAADPQLQSVVRLLASEATNGRPGSRAVATRLTEVLFVLTVRNWLERAGAEDSGPSWLTALRDPDIGAALSLMHERPQEDWTVDSLARAVAMSRPTFARRFKSTVGASPLAYLSRVRLDQAARQLRDTDDSLGIIARKVGYASEFAFSRAFTRELGVPPSRYRRAVAV